MITKRQKQILDFIKSFKKKRGYAPSLEEIKRRFRFASVSTAHFHVKKLQELGYLRKEENQPRAIDVYKKEQMVQIPLLGTVAAGQPIEGIEDKETIAVPKLKLPRDGDFYALRVSGDSMIDENISNGDMVIVKNQPTADNGQRVVALIDNCEVTLKKIYKEKDKIRLQPANPTMNPIFVKPDNLIIQGVVIDVIKSLSQKEEVEVRETPTIKKAQDFQDKVFCEDCAEGLKKIASNSIDCCITDPPYNYEFIGHKWDSNEIKRRINRVQNSKTLVKHIPYGSGLAGGVRNKRWYEKNAANINQYQKWTLQWGKEVFRVLKPGAYILVFNSSRTIAHIQIALEEAGFYARDIIVWRKNSGIPKGLNLSKKLKNEGMDSSNEWKGWHSCLRNEWEAIALLQKPLVNNYLNTVKKFNIGLLFTKNNDGSFQSNILENYNHELKEKFNVHCTVKPVALITKLIKLTIPLEKNKIVLDPFMGSGTTAIAALKNNIKFLGYEINNEYCDIIRKRINNYKKEEKQKLF